MNGIVYKRPGSPYWYVAKTRQSTKTTNRKQAEEFARKVLSDIWRQTTLGEYPTTWKDLAADWLQAKESKKSLFIDIRVIANITKELGSGDALASLVNENLLSTYASKVKKNTSAATANRELNVIRAMLRRAHKLKKIPECPVVEHFPVPTKKGTIRWLTPEQLDGFMAMLPSWMKDIVLLAVNTGLRSSNFRLLRWEWISDGVITVPAVFAKTQDVYTVPVNSVAREIIERQRGKNPTFVFVRPDGRPITKQTLKYHWNRARTAFGMPKLRPHDLRHTFASWHRQNGTPDHIIMEICGWKKSAMLENYAKVAPAHLATYADNLNKEISFMNSQGDNKLYQAKANAAELEQIIELLLKDGQNEKAATYSARLDHYYQVINSYEETRRQTAIQAR